MGIAVMEDLLHTIRAILKTLECSICLDMLKMPVSVGCGHFFCRDCVLGVLDSHYRAPCPLCKKSFTRRSIQGAAQRQAIISAAKSLVERCEKLTGVNVFSKENFGRESPNEWDLSLQAPTKKQKSMEANESLQSKKRKSCENDEECNPSLLSNIAINKRESSTDRVTITGSAAKTPIYSDVEGSASKRQCQSTLENDDDDDDDIELPSLEELFAHAKKHMNKSDPSTTKIQMHPEKPHKETPLSIKPQDRCLQLKTYSKHNLKISNSKRREADAVFDFIANETSIMNTQGKNLENKLKEAQSIADNSVENECFASLNHVGNETESNVKRMNKRNVPESKVMEVIKNKRNALRNKTNVNSDKYIMNEDGFLSANSEQVKDIKKSNGKRNIEKRFVTKENEKNDTSHVVDDEKAVLDNDSLSKSKQIKTDKGKKGLRRRPSKAKKRGHKVDTVVSSSSADEEVNSKLYGRGNISKSEKLSKKNLSKNICDGAECFNLNETLITNRDVEYNNETASECKHVEEVLKSEESADSAVSVHSVISPPTNKLLSFSKSPGWSRVKQVGKDFRVKTFSTLLIEKNLPSNTSKNKSDILSDAVMHNKTSDGTDESAKFIQLSQAVRTVISSKPASPSNKTENQSYTDGCLIQDSSNLRAHEGMSNMQHFSNDIEKEAVIETANELNNANMYDECLGQNRFEATDACHEKNSISDKELDMEVVSKDEQMFGNMNKEQEIFEKSLAHSQNEISVPPLLNLEGTEQFDNASKCHENQMFIVSSDIQKEDAENICEPLLADNIISDNSEMENIRSERNVHSQNNFHMAQVIQKEFNVRKHKNDESCTVITVQVENPRLKKVNIGLNYEDKTTVNALEHMSANDSKKANHTVGKQIMRDTNIVSEKMSPNISAPSKNIGSKKLLQKQKYFRKSDSNLIIHSNTLNKSMDASSAKNAKILTSQKYIEFRNVDEKNEKGMYHFRASELKKQSEFTSDFGKVSECEITTTESVANNDENNVYYVEHSQQTSQKFPNYNHEKAENSCNSMPGSVVECALNKIANVAQNNDISNEIGQSCWNETTRDCFDASTLNSGKTKVLKRTCLTLDEIHDFFLKNSKSGHAETICSLPFLSGQYLLDICISEETLNVSVLKTVDNKLESGMNIPTSNVMVRERSVQTSKFNTPVHSPRILPSSNAESESSLPDLCNLVKTAKNNGPFPFLQCSLNTFPHVTVENVEVSNENTNLAVHEESCSKFPSCENAEGSPIDIANEALHHICGENLDEIDTTANTSAIIHYPKLGSENCKETKQDRLTEDLGNFSINKEPDDHLSYVVNDRNSVVFPDELCAESSKVHCEGKLTKSLSHDNENLDDNPMDFSSEECDPFNEHTSRYRSTPVKLSHYKYVYDDSEGSSTDPDMVYANAAVAPLKSIAQKMDCTKDASDTVTQSQKKAHTYEDNSGVKLNKSLEICNEEKFVKILDSCKNKVVRKKPSRLSLKMKKNVTKFKRIQSCESSEDSDSAELEIKSQSGASNVSVARREKAETSHNSKNLLLSSASSSKQLPDNRDEKRGNKSAHSEVSETGEDPNTFNSNLSDDIPNANASEIKMEIEDLDKKIKSLEEKLKQCGHTENLQGANSGNLRKNNENCNEIPESNSSYVNLEDSEDSTDLFPHTVPPTPPDATLRSDANSFFKCF